MWSCYCSVRLVSACEGHKVYAQLRHMTASASDPYGGWPVAIPVLAKLVIKGTTSSSRLWLARRMGGAIATLPGRAIHLVADSAYADGELKKLPARVTWTTRLRKDAALYGLRRPGPASAGPRHWETGSPAWPNSPPPRHPGRSPSPATARSP